MKIRLQILVARLEFPERRVFAERHHCRYCLYASRLGRCLSNPAGMIAYYLCARVHLHDASDDPAVAVRMSTLLHL